MLLGDTKSPELSIRSTLAGMGVHVPGHGGAVLLLVGACQRKAQLVLSGGENACGSGGRSYLAILQASVIRKCPPKNRSHRPSHTTPHTYQHPSTHYTHHTHPPTYSPTPSRTHPHPPFLLPRCYCLRVSRSSRVLPTLRESRCCTWAWARCAWRQPVQSHAPAPARASNHMPPPSSHRLGAYREAHAASSMESRSPWSSSLPRRRVR